MNEASHPRRVHIIRQYIKDLSFENFVPAHVLTKDMPKMQLDIHVSAQKLQKQEAAYEVSIQLKAHAKAETTSLFVAELHYAAACNLVASAAHDLQRVLLIDVPQQLFPFVRRLLADITRDGGVAPLWLDPIDFNALYEARLATQPQTSPPSKNTNGKNGSADHFDAPPKARKRAPGAKSKPS